MNNEILQSMRILPVEAIFPFEYEMDNDRTVSIDDFHHIRHPLIVTEISAGKFLLLDQTEDFYLYLSAGIRFVPVQVIARSAITLVQHQIGLYSFDQSDLQKLQTDLHEHLIQVPTGTIKEITPAATVTIAFNSQAYQFELVEQQNSYIDSLKALFEYFDKSGGYGIIKELSALKDKLMKASRFKAAVSPPGYTIDMIISAAENNLLLPPGLFRFETLVRMLYVDFPVSALMSDISLSEKEEFLKELILLREQTEKTSFFQGRIYLFNK